MSHANSPVCAGRTSSAPSTDFSNQLFRVAGTEFAVGGWQSIFGHCSAYFSSPPAKPSLSCLTQKSSHCASGSPSRAHGSTASALVRPLMASYWIRPPLSSAPASSSR